VKAHFNRRATEATTNFKRRRAATVKKIAKTAAAAALKERADEARDAREVGTRFLLPYGGAHTWVTAANKEVRDLLYLESNHSPPNDSYKGSKYDALSIGQRPAHAMLFYHHRAPRGRLNGASSTGGSGVNKGWGSELNALMKQGKFGEAMKRDFRDVLNTTHPNTSYYALALYRAALYARNTTFAFGDGTSGTLITDEEFAEIVAILPIDPTQVAEAVTDVEAVR
jgi:hypothetical protein